ncbi:hypothetical protein HK096_009866, partial [Nowakowskiella sp. JEL0078]
RKHVLKTYSHPMGNLVINEDGWGLFNFNISVNSSSLSSSLSLRFHSFFLCDGHGSTATLPLASERVSSWIGSTAEQYIAKLRPIIAETVHKNVCKAVSKWSQDFFESQDMEIFRLRKEIETALCMLQADIDIEFEKTDNKLDRDNGSTLVLGITLEIYKTFEYSNLKIDSNFAFFVNVGDSSMMLIDRTKGLPLSVWQRPEIDSEPSICSFEDTLASFPSKLREGQSQSAVQEDLNKVKNFFREVRH